MTFVIVDAVVVFLVASLAFLLADRLRARKTAPAPAPPPAAAATRSPSTSTTVDLTLANQLPTFVSVGNLDDIKEEMRSTVGLLMRHPAEARQYRVTWNGLLFHGSPGVGKSFFVQALAGEFGASLVRVTGGDLSAVRGAAAPALVDEAFR